MKQLLTLTALFAFAPFSMAQPLSDSNPVERELVLKDGELAIGGGIHFGETKSGKEHWSPSVALAYGLTDNLTVGPLGARYSLVNRGESRLGFELTAEAGLMGLYEVDNADESFAVGAGLNGKYVFDENLALTFGAALVHWEEDKRDNRKEAQVSLGAMWQLHPGLTISTDLQYRKFKDFVQDHSTAVSTSLTWAYSAQLDVVFSTAYSDFDPIKNGYKQDVEYQKQMGLSVLYRF